MKGDMSDAEEFELLEISLLRDMLYLEFRPQNVRTQSRRGSFNPPPRGAPEKLPFKYEAMRVVDDFVFMCMLVGNDFVPHIPHLDIAEGALNLMFRSYKELMPTWGEPADPLLIAYVRGTGMNRPADGIALPCFIQAAT